MSHNFVSHKFVLRKKSTIFAMSISNHTMKETFDLGSPSNLPRLKAALLERDLIEMDGRNVYISDPLFERWLRERG